MRIRELLQTELWSKEQLTEDPSFEFGILAVRILLGFRSWYELMLHWLTASGERRAGRVGIARRSTNWKISSTATTISFNA